MASVGPRWCKKHGRWECAGPRYGDGGRCHVRAQETPYCSSHQVAGHSAPSTGGGLPLDTADAIRRSRKYGEANLAAWQAAVPDDPASVVLKQLEMALIRADLYAAMRTSAALVVREADWRARAVRFAQAALDMGAAEHHIQRVGDAAAAAAKAFRDAMGDEDPPPDVGVPAKTP